MIFLDNAQNNILGKKAESLAQIFNLNINIPNGFVLAPNNNFSDDQLQSAIEKLGGYPVAVRSSGALEDLSDASFAGMYETYLEVQDLEQLKASIAKCFASSNSERIHEYLKKSQINITKEEIQSQFYVLIQKQVIAKYAGVLFTIDPMSGKEEESLIECCHGLGEKLVSGLISPTRITVNNETGLVSAQDLGDQLVYLEKDHMDDLLKASFKIAAFHKKPQDIEWAIDEDNKLWILQARPITTIKWRTDMDEFTNADLKDGGISSKICTPMMYSLYELSMVDSMADYFDKINVISKKSNTNFFTYKYGRGYWNAGAIKRGLYKIPGFSEEVFDKDLGIQKKYSENGPHKTGTNPLTILGAIPVLLGLNKEFKASMEMGESFKSWFEKEDQFWKDYLASNHKKLKENFIKMITRYYQVTESSYFRIVYNNSNYQSTYKDFIDGINKKMPKPLNVLSLMGDLDEVSHLEVQVDLYDLYFIAKDNGIDSEEYQKQKISFLQKHYHHGDSELDLLVPRWGEVPHRIDEMIQSYLQSSMSPVKASDDINEFELEYARGVKFIEENLFLKFTKLNDFKDKTKTMREFLVLREKMREFSTRSYYIVRKFLLLLDKKLNDENILKAKSDIFYLKINEVLKICEGKIDEDLPSTLARRKNRFSVFTDLIAPNEFGRGIEIKQNNKAKIIDGQKTYQGVGCSSGIFEGKARVIFSPSDINLIEKNEILITKFTDPGWTPVLGVVSAVVTEVGGVLSHAAVIGREYGIPAVLNIQGISSQIKTGQLIRVDGDKGTVTVL